MTYSQVLKKIPLGGEPIGTVATLNSVLGPAAVASLKRLLGDVITAVLAEREQAVNVYLLVAQLDMPRHIGLGGKC